MAVAAGLVGCFAVMRRMTLAAAAFFAHCPAGNRSGSFTEWLRYFGVPLIDPVVSVIVAAAIAWTSWRLVRGASHILADGAAAQLEDIVRAAGSVEEVRGCHDVRARGSRGMVRIDLHIAVDPQMTVAQSHELAERVERQIRAQVKAGRA
jgi:divalent metal cation (Fe/Co/Zn/Cd) transporter